MDNKTEVVFINGDNSFVVSLEEDLESIKQDILELIHKYGDITVKDELYKRFRTLPFIIEGEELIPVI